MNSPASIIESPMALAVRATKVNDSNEECKQMFVSSCVAVKLDLIPFFGIIRSCCLGVRNAKL